MAAHKGHKRAGGRKPGGVNKSTASVKAALVEAFEKRGGVPSLVAWADSEPTEFYKLWSRMLPTEVKADLSGAVSLIVRQVIVRAENKPRPEPPPGPS